jgi:hypothetical protein
LRNVPANGDHNGLWKQWDRFFYTAEHFSYAFMALVAKMNLSENLWVTVVKLVYIQTCLRIMRRVTWFEICSISSFQAISRNSFGVRLAAFMSLQLSVRPFVRLSAWNKCIRYGLLESWYWGFLLKFVDMNRLYSKSDKNEPDLA